MISEDDIWKVFFQQVTPSSFTTISNTKCRCENGQYIEKEGHETCTICGWVSQDTIIDPGKEWTNYSDDSSRYQKERAERINPLLPKSSIGSWAARPKGRNVKLPSWFARQHWGAIPGKERRQKKVFQEMDETGRRLGIPEMIIHSAKTYYKLVSDYKIARIRALRVSCIYYACKEAGVPRDGGELASMMGYDPKKLTKSNEQFLKVLKQLKGKTNGYMTVTNCNFGSAKAEDS